MTIVILFSSSFFLRETLLNLSHIKVKIFEVGGFKDILPAQPLGPLEVHLWIIGALPPEGTTSLEAIRPLLDFYGGPQIQVKRNANGKPFLWDNEIEPSSVHFNLSHSKGNFAVAFAHNAQVGIDIEAQHLKKNWLKLAERFYSPQEFEFIKTSAIEHQEDLVYQFWTLKEAFIKCRGESLFVGLPKARFRITANGIELETPDESTGTMLFGHRKTNIYLSLAYSPLPNLKTREANCP